MVVVVVVVVVVVAVAVVVAAVVLVCVSVRAGFRVVLHRGALLSKMGWVTSTSHVSWGYPLPFYFDFRALPKVAPPLIL